MNKFITFLESLKNEENSVLIENVITGYKAVHEVIEPITGMDIPLDELKADLIEQISASTDVDELKDMSMSLLQELGKKSAPEAPVERPDELN